MSYDVPAGPPPLPQAPPPPPPPPGGPADGVLAPVLVAFDPPAAQSRGTVLIRFLMVIPHLIVLWALGIAAGVIAFISWFAALFTGRLPAFAADFLTGYLRWQTRVYAYSMMLTGVYPPFTLEDAPYPVRVVTMPGRLNRLAVFFRFILLIPAWLVTAIAGLGAYTIVAFVAWLIVLIRGSMPETLHQAYAAVLRYTSRAYGYHLMLTSAYPGGLFGDSADAAYAPPGFPPPPGFSPPPGFGPQPGFGPGAGFGPQPGFPPGGGFGPHPGSPPQPGFSPQGGFGAQPGSPPEPGFPPPGNPASDEGFTPAPGFPPPGAPVPPPGAPTPDQGFATGPDFASAEPGYPPPPGYAPPPPGAPGNPWLLVLSSGARKLVGWFLVIGVLVLAGIIAVDVVATSKAVTKVEAYNNLQAAANTINAASAPAGSSLQGCQSAACVQKYAGQLSTAYAHLATTVQGIAMPTSQDSAAAATVAADANKVAAAYHQLATAPESQYASIATNAADAQNTLKNDFDSLQSSLAG